MPHQLIAIVAMTEDRVIGANNKLPWHIPEDLKHFKETTKGHTVIMGRKTHESLGVPFLPDRNNIVLSSDPDYAKDLVCSSFLLKPSLSVVPSMERALDLAISVTPFDGNIFLIGGASVFNEYLHACDRIIVSHICKRFDGDACFPEIDEDLFVPETVGNIQGTDIPFFITNYCRV